ncbi:hypothetical protein Mtc_2171 [Methanocella conradii HZ254]|uniref:Uncharacterized protein n=1 Tax=Methanocella conradii (strain DSM 24694 / JCM 17849 / CGMCC 1.5162 / HZ254) TaxID=1041930 RepID=H8I9U8_METCZ|nr:hypothetical protein Mtc_2171 [Methanocella conradii HZ254]
MGSIITENKYVIAFYWAVMTGGTAINTLIYIHWLINWTCMTRAGVAR